MIERVDLRPDSAVVRWRHAPGDGPELREFGDLRVHADRERLPSLGDEYEWSTGGRITTVYPVPARRHRLVFQLDRRFRPGKPVQRGPWSATLDLP